MPIDTDLSVAPYFDDSAANDQYYQVLFRPAVSVQVRELNAMQSLLRRQVERFGDAILQRGTVVEGCNFSFYPQYPYARVRDTTAAGDLATPSAYVGMFVRNSSNLQAIVVDSADGFESTAPDLNTLYLAYRNAGSDGNTHAFSPGDTLTVFAAGDGLAAVAVNSSGVGFSNGDDVVVTPAVVVNVSSGSFSSGDYVTQPTTGANLQVVAVDSSTLASRGQVIIGLRPRSVDLANSSSNSSTWAVANNDTIRSAGNTAVGLVEGVVGGSGAADLVTDGSGRVLQVTVVDAGRGYTTPPVVTVRSPGNDAGVSSLSLTARTWLTQLLVANTAGSVGNGYAFGVGEGVAYLKGLFVSVPAQTVVVSKYDSSPNAVSVGLTAAESLVNSSVDPSLLDNATGEPNENAPGADRLRLRAQLTVTADSDAPAGVTQLVSWSEGQPYRQNQTAIYSGIGDEMARRTREASGDFVLDRFEVTTRSPQAANAEGPSFSVVVDPGKGYVGGRRVESLDNYVVDTDKGLGDSVVLPPSSLRLNYGNYVELRELGGVFQFSTADQVTLWDTPKRFLSNTSLAASGNTTPQGAQVGVARTRSLEHESGTPGDPNAAYRLYLFDVTMATGRNFRDVRCVAYSGAGGNGVADVVLSLDATLGTNTASVVNAALNQLVFPVGVASVRNASNVCYPYRTIDQTLSFSNAGLLTKSLAGSPGESFSPAGAWTADDARDLYVVATGNTLYFSANVAGNVDCSAASATLTGHGTGFVSALAPGDYLQLYQNSTVTDTRRVAYVANDTSLVMDANAAFTATGVAAYRCFPRWTPLPFGVRSGLTANVSANGSVLTLSLGGALRGSVSVNAAVAVDVQRTDAAPATKSAARDQHVKLSLANNAAGVAGPWCLGVPDAIRLKGVWRGSSSAVDDASQDVSSWFYVDPGQRKGFVGPSWLVLRPGAPGSLTSADWLLVRFDHFTSSGPGYFDAVSYVGSDAGTIAAVDSTPLANLGSSVASLEVPELHTDRGGFFDLLGCLDFRPIAANTVAPAANASLAPVNPPATLSFGNTADPANDKKFPKPDALLTATIEAWEGRVDSVFLGPDGRITLARGAPSANPTKRRPPNQPSGVVKLADVSVPPYPSVPARASLLLSEVATTRVGTELLSGSRLAGKQIRSLTAQPGTPLDSQPRGYTMADVGALDRRLQAVEYYVSLSQLETDVTSRVVPSSTDPTLDRFKYGFFADSFSTGVSQDTTSPAYAARVAADRLTPSAVSWTVPLAPAHAAPTYTERAVVTEPDATLPASNSVVILQPPASGANTGWLLRTDRFGNNSIVGGNGPTSGQAVDVATCRMAAESGNAVLYFAVPATVTRTLVVDPDSIVVYRGNAVVASTVANLNMSALTNADSAYLLSNSVPASWFQSVTRSNTGGLLPLTRFSGGFVSGAGKLTFAHDPATGRDYTVVTTRQSVYDHWRWAMSFPQDLSDAGQVAQPTSSPPPAYLGRAVCEPETLVLMMRPPGSDPDAATEVTVQVPNGMAVSPSGGGLGVPGVESYEGMVNFLNSESVSSEKTDGANKSAQPTLVPQAFTLWVTGLKPSTRHAFTVQGVDKGARCRPFGGALGDAIVTDSTGAAQFDYFYDPSVDQDTTHSLISSVPVSVDWASQQSAPEFDTTGVGALALALSAPNSLATFRLAGRAEQDLLSTSGS